MKILDRIVDGLIRQVVSIDDSQFGFVPGRALYRCNLCGPTAAGEIPSSEQEALYGLLGLDLEKAFDCVPPKVNLVGPEKARC